MSNQTISFETDIKPLFRDTDVDAMQAWFELSKYEDVKENADAICERLEDGTMPCDGAWSPENIKKFKAWMEAGFPE